MNLMKFKGKKVLILGYSITGISVAKFLTSLGAKCFISEFDATKKASAPDGVEVEFGVHSKEFIEGTDLVVTSPGISPTAPIFATLKEKNIEYISDIELAHRFNLNSPEPKKIIAVTGTNGKTTTTMLLSHILSAPACGNIGVSPCDFLLESDSCLVLETSSFQAHYSPTFSPEIAIFTNLTPDHVYFHGSVQEYFEAKAKIFRNMKPNQSAVLNLDDETVSALASELECKTYFFSTKKEADACVKNGALYFQNEKIIDVKDVPIVGEHNLQNALASIAAAKIAGVDSETIQAKIKTFRAPEHRCEFVTEFNNIKFYNDSKATNPEATIVALKSFEGANVALIAGGRDKNTTLEEFCSVVKKTMKSVILIGEATDRFEKELRDSGYDAVFKAQTLEQAIDTAISQKPDVVLLSPACASFDMFKSFEHRGEEFKKYVLKRRL